MGPWLALLQDRRRALAIYTAVVAILLTIFLVGGLANAKFGAIDDHEIIRMLGPDVNLTIPEMTDELLKTEVGQPLEAVRYRPFYYISKVLETGFLADNPGAHYWYRILLFAIGTAGFLWVAVRAVGVLAGTTLVAITIGLPFWFDVWPRLGPNEQYASVGLALVLVGLANIIRRLWARDTGHWNTSLAVMSVGVFIAAGSKENFSILALPMLMTTVLGWRMQRLKPWAIALAVLSMAYCGVVIFSTLLGVLQAGRDLHGESAGSRMDAFGVALAQFFNPDLSPYPYKRQLGPSLLFLQGALLTAFITAIGCALLWFFGDKSKRPGFARLLRFVVAIVGMAGIWLLWEIVFYNGAWPTGMRYDFPGILIAPILLGASLLLWRAWLPEAGYWRRGLNVAVLTAALLAWWSGALPLFTELRTVVSTNEHRTIEFDAGLTQSVAMASENPDWPVIIETQHGMDYEPALTIPLWLQWKGLENPLFLRVPPPDPNAPADFIMQLQNAMREQSNAGNADYRPISELDPAREAAGECYSLSYSGPVAPTCTPLTVKW